MQRIQVYEYSEKEEAYWEAMVLLHDAKEKFIDMMNFPFGFIFNNDLGCYVQDMNDVKNEINEIEKYIKSL